MKKKISLGVVALGTTSLLIWHTLPERSDNKHLAHSLKHAGHSHAQLPQGEPLVRNGQVLSTGKDTFQPKSRPTSTREQNAANASHEKDTIIWHESEQAKASMQSSGLIPADVNNEVYIEIDRKELLTVEVGEYLDLFIPQLGGSYTGEVDFIQTHPNGDRTVEAHIPGAGSLYSAVITLGEKAIYGNLATQEDVFILEGVGNYAWLAPKSAMINNHHEHTMPAEVTSRDANSNRDSDVFDIGKDLSPQQ